MAALHTVASLRNEGVAVWSTMDAGPHVKALCEARDAARVRDALEQAPGVLETIISSPGDEIQVSP